MSNLQLDINFNSSEENRFKKTLDAGEFTLLFEHASPGKDNDPAASGERLRLLENAINSIPGIHAALAITDGYGTSSHWRAIEYASALPVENRDRHLVYLSGRNLDLDESAALLRIAENHNLPNIAICSGGAEPNCNIRDLRKSYFADSVRTLREWEEGGKFFLGAVTNPMQYNSFSLMAQYSKLIKKLSVGAKFIVTQANWDMLKLQSLIWYLNERSIFVPVLSRLVLLSPEKMEAILSGKMPGVHISPDLEAILKQESRFSRAQFEAAQYRRLELQAAGCRLLGCSGIQLVGADNPERAAIAGERVRQALEEFTDFDQWLQSYNSHLSKAEMAPSSKSFYLYDRTLKRNHPAIPLKMNELGAPNISTRERLLYRIRKFFFPHAGSQKADSRRLLKTLLCGCRGCDQCTLERNEFVCPMRCPKRQINGPCGSARTNGNCFIGNHECVQQRIMRLAAANGNAIMREEDVI